MKDIPDFKIDEWMREHGSLAQIPLHIHSEDWLPRTNLVAGSYVSPLSLNGLKQLAGDVGHSPVDEDLQLTYGNVRGSVKLRERIAELHSSRDVRLTADNVVITTGSILANYLTLTSLCGPGDHVICQFPTYGQLYILPRYMGADMDMWQMRAEHDWIPSVDELAGLIKPNTKAIILNNPSNPTGTVLSNAVLNSIIALARARNILIISDEVFAPLFHGADRPSPFVSLGYPRSLSTGSVSKAHGLPGVRLGWIVSPDAALLRRVMTARDYTTIAVSQLDDGVAAFALAPDVLPTLLDRNLAICRRSIERLEAFVQANPTRCRWVRPQGAGTAFIQVLDGQGSPVDDAAFARSLVQTKAVSVIPGGHAFGEEGVADFRGYIRVNLGYDGALERGLPLLQEFLDQY